MAHSNAHWAKRTNRHKASFPYKGRFFRGTAFLLRQPLEQNILHQNLHIQPEIYNFRKQTIATSTKRRILFYGVIVGMKKIITTILATTAVCTSIIYAQLPNIIRNDMVINGLTLCNSYTKEQMIEALGQPDSISVFTSEAGVINKYYYGNDFFTVIEEGQLFVDFTVTNPRFKFNNLLALATP